jgi:uncharacterized protein YciW
VAHKSHYTTRREEKEGEEEQEGAGNPKPTPLLEYAREG